MAFSEGKTGGRLMTRSILSHDPWRSPRLALAAFAATRRRNPWLCRELVGVSTIMRGKRLPGWLNPMSTEFYKRELLRLGYSDADATKLLKDFPGNPAAHGEYIKIMGTRGDKKTNVYAHPNRPMTPA